MEISKGSKKEGRERKLSTQGMKKEQTNIILKTFRKRPNFI